MDELNIVMRKPAFCSLPKTMMHISSTVAKADQNFYAAKIIQTLQF